MRAYVLITAQVGQAEPVALYLKEHGIEVVDHVAGISDLVAVLESEDPREIGEKVVRTIQRTPGVQSTVTLMTLK